MSYSRPLLSHLWGCPMDATRKGPSTWLCTVWDGHYTELAFWRGVYVTRRWVGYDEIVWC
ncbi:hypothetical protein BLAT2472_170022 [Burkholderia latens]